MSDRVSGISLMVASGIIVSLCALTGCAGPADKDAPRQRTGALPFPGLFTLYRTADPQRLGPHRYGRKPHLFARDEAERGILYTQRAGFLDLAHVRVTIDWTRFYARRVRAAIDLQREQLTLPTMDGTTLHVTLSYPSDWLTTETPAHDPLADELALRTGQRLAFEMMTWHEVLTWFGFRKVIIIDEMPSAFTYDDAMSHVIGLRVAERALRDTQRSFDDAVTLALREELADLGTVPPAHTTRIARAVRGVWWSDSKPLKRQVDVGMHDDAVRPWLVRGSPFAADIEPERFALPTLDDVVGRDFSGFLSVRIDPGSAQAQRIRATLPDHPADLRSERDLPRLLEIARSQMKRKFSPDVDTPWPAVASTQPAGEGQRLSLARPLQQRR